MHLNARQWFEMASVKLRQSTTQPRVLEIGSRNVNGSIRELFTDWCGHYCGIDLVAGEGVDVIADGLKWRLNDHDWDIVLCAEVLEHCQEWPDLVAAATSHVSTYGSLVMTCAGPGREPHSAKREGPPDPGEYYGNINPVVFLRTLLGGWMDVTVNVWGPDLRCLAYKPTEER